VAEVVTVHAAKTHLSRLLKAVEAGQEVIIVRGRQPVARLVPYAPPVRRPLGFVPGRLTEAFFEPLPEEEQTAWEGKSCDSSSTPTSSCGP